jgi:cytochrome c553
MNRIVLGAVLAPVLALFATVASSAEVAVPEKAAACAACHGEGGAKPIVPSYPVLAGQYANYLEHALHEYQDGRRKNAVMAAQATTLSKQEIKALALYFAAQPGPLYTPMMGETTAAAPVTEKQ